jgi:glycolate oxidase FAD binding subunit
VVATNRTGPWRAAYRTPRDWVIGLSVVAPDGRLVKGGGRVVKNVAGYDLPRLYTGSRGTLGVIVEVSFKVMPRPPSAVLSVVPLPDADRAEAALARIMDSDLMPTCLELLNDAAWREVGPAAAGTAPLVLLAGFEGVPAAIEWQAGELERRVVGISGVAQLSDEERESVLDGVRQFPLRLACLVAQANLLSSDVAAVAARCEAEAAAAGLALSLAAHAANGVLRLRLAPAPGEIARAVSCIEAIGAEAALRGGSLVVTGGASEIAGEVDLWGPPGPDARLMRGLRAALDPHGTLYAGGFLS